MKLLTCETMRITRRSTALMVMDAAACYDRIITYLSSLNERRYGLPPSACAVKGSVVFEMRRHVRTAFGDSSAFYTSTEDDLLHGECQGKTSSPPSWGLYTVILLRALKKINPGVSLSDISGSHTVSRVAGMFVDDCDLWTSLPSDATEADLIHTFGKAAQAWERHLRWSSRPPQMLLVVNCLGLESRPSTPPTYLDGFS